MFLRCLNNEEESMFKYKKYDYKKTTNSSAHKFVDGDFHKKSVTIVTVLQINGF